MIGQFLGPYEVLAELGEGGMGEVYRARDSRLSRDVAIKVLPEGFASDPDRRARFEREMRAVAGLSHPNVVAIFDTGLHAGQLYAVTELLHGETLRDRLVKDSSGLTTRAAVDIAVQMARGLGAAHAASLVHRDLKPENVFLLKDGRVKILDFGLARQPSEASGAARTMTVMTDPGTVMGTAGYMAPEQVRGAAIDARADVFALGVVLHEMLTGQRAFFRATTADTMAAILREDAADLHAMRPDLPPALERIVRHCLEKNPDDRFQSAQDVSFALGELSGAGSAATAAFAPAAGAPAAALRVRSGWRATGLVLAGLLAGIGAATYLRPAQPPDPVVRFSLSAAEGLSLNKFSPPAVSPDGRSVVFLAGRGDGSEQLWIWHIGDARARPIVGGYGAHPFWSWDGSAIAFFGPDGKLKKANLAGGAVETICDAGGGTDERGGTWSQHDVILFSGRDGRLRQVAAVAGATPAEVAVPDPSRGRLSYRWPQFLPDGNHFFFTDDGLEPTAYVGSLDDPQPKRLMTVQQGRVLYAEGFAIFIAGRSLLAQRFDPAALALVGSPSRVADFEVTSQTGTFGVGAGTLVFASTDRATTLAWFDRQGRETPWPGVEPGEYGWPSISKQGQIAIDRIDPKSGRRSVYTLDARGASTLISMDSTDNADAVWSPTGRSLAYAHDLGSAIVEYEFDKAKPSKVLLPPGARDQAYPTDWSTEGVAYSGFESGADIFLWSYEQAKSIALRRTAANEHQARFSPDGRWLAFSTDESGRPEVWLEPRDPGRERKKISATGGTQPMWGKTGELFYISLDNWMVAVPVQLGSAVTVGEPVRLFPLRIEESTFYWVRNHYAVAPNGQFLVNSVSIRPPDVLVNWQLALGR